MRQTKDLRLTDNGDGTLTLVGLSTGALFAYGPDGERLDIRAGMSRETFLVDTKGTADPIDDELTPVGDPVTAGLDTTTRLLHGLLRGDPGVEPTWQLLACLYLG